MKKFCILPLIAALAFFVSCQKQQSEEEKRAEVERQVQERLASERQADEKQRLAQQQAELEAREKALADKEVAAARTPVPKSVVTPTERVIRERSETRSETTATYGTFYQKLEPYGAWRETADYGYVWQPREAEERGWRPYTEGRWAYSDAGWTWISDEPFGWATYHYGRWLRLRRVGWVWVPGNEWAPAWVSWRTSKDYVGWAPLPPEARFDRKHGIHNWADSYYDIGPDQYSFVPGNEFGSQHVRRSVVSADRNITIVNETTNVTNITYSNTTIINQGPDYDELRSRSRQPMERYRLRREADSESTTATVRGDEIVISISLFSNVPGFHRPRTVKERVSEVVVDNGWTAIADRSAAERTRAKMKAEATPPPDAPSKTFVKPQESTTSATPATTPAATAAPSASPTTAASATPATASPTVAATSPTPAAASPSPTAQATATPSPAASPSPSVRTRPSPSASPSTEASATVAPAATASPMVSASPSVRVRPSAPMLRPSQSIAPSGSPDTTATEPASKTPSQAEQIEMLREAARKNRRPPTSPATINPASSPAASASTPPIQIPRRMTPPPVTTPAVAATPAVITEPVTTPPPKFTPATPTVPPAVTQPVATPPVPESSPAAAAPSPTPAPSPTAASDDKSKHKKPKRPDAGDSETPTPAPSNPPN